MVKREKYYNSNNCNINKIPMGGKQNKNWVKKKKEKLHFSLEVAQSCNRIKNTVVTINTDNHNTIFFKNIFNTFSTLWNFFNHTFFKYCTPLFPKQKNNNNNKMKARWEKLSQFHFLYQNK